WEDHLDAIRRVFAALAKAGFTLIRSKCHFCLPEMTILGLSFSSKGLHLRGEHTKAVREYPRPTTRHQVQQFLGLAGYFRKFVRNFAAIAKPLNILLKKDLKFDWSPKCEQAFESLKDAILSSNALQLPDYDHEFIIESDASDSGV